MKTPFIEKCLRRTIFAKRFDRLPRNFLSVVPSLFARTYPNFVTFDRFFKTKKKISKIRKKSEKVHKYSNKFEKWGCGCTISLSPSPHIDAWRKNCLQSGPDPIQSILEKRKNFESGPLCSEQFFFFDEL